MTAPVVTGTSATKVTGTGAGFAPHRGDDRIATCVEIGYDNPVSFGKPNGQWVDVTDKVRELSTTRGRQAELQRFEAGTLTCKLDNRSGNLSRWIGSGVMVGCPIRVRISSEKSDPTGASPPLDKYDPHDGGFFPAWFGFIERLDYDWSPGGNSDGTVTITASDPFALFSRAELINFVFSSGGTYSDFDPFNLPFITGLELQYGHDRLVQAFEQSGIKPLLAGLYITYEVAGYTSPFGSGTAPIAPVIDSGATNPVNGSALSHLQEIAEAAFIDFYARPDGVIAWRSFGEVRDDTFDGTTIFGDNVPTEIPYRAVGPVYDDENLFNDVTITLGDGTVSTSVDQTSKNTYGRRVMQKTVPVYPYTIDGASNGFAGSRYANALAYVTRYKDPIVRIPSIEVSLRSLTDAQRMRVLSLPIGYRVQVKRRAIGGTLTAECHFEGVSLSWAAGMVEVTAVLNLAPTRSPGSYSL